MTSTDIERAWQILATVPDPEIPVISIVELGVVRDVRKAGGALIVDITPTYAGCPALEQMRSDALQALQAAGFETVINTVLSPAWSSSWLGEAAREKLRAYGIAPPHTQPHTQPQNGAQPLQFHLPSHYKPACPQCASRNTERLSEFGSTACKALYRCLACREPFDYFKPY